jgi:hypothetical protein
MKYVSLWGKITGLTELNLYLHSVNPKVTKPLDIEHVNKAYSYNMQRHTNNISIKYKYTETIKDTGVKYKYTRNSRYYRWT